MHTREADVSHVWFWHFCLFICLWKTQTNKWSKTPPISTFPEVRTFTAPSTALSVRSCSSNQTLAERQWQKTPKPKKLFGLTEVEDLLFRSSPREGSSWVAHLRYKVKQRWTLWINRDKSHPVETNWATDTTIKSHSHIHPSASCSFQFLNGLTIYITSCAGREIIIFSHLISG